MKYSIIIPLYNKESTIRRALYSALDQNNVDHNEIEILVVNDGSSDSSFDEIVKVVCEQSRPQITLINQLNAGVSAARNAGAAYAKGEILCFLDADDTYKPNFLSELNNLISEFPQCSLFATAYNFINTAKGSKTKAKLRNLESTTRPQILSNFFLSASSGDLPFCASSFGMTKQAFLELGGFPESESMGEDQDLYIRVALNKKIAFSPTPCANYFVDVQGSLMNTQQALEEMPYSKRLQNRLDLNEVSPELIPSVRQYISGHLIDLVRRNLENGCNSEARNLLTDRRSKIKTLRWFYWYIRCGFSRQLGFLKR